MRKPLPQLHELTVDDLGHEGQGIARADGKALFVHGALPSEIVDVQLRKRGRSYDEGDAVAVHRPSPQRVTPRCAVFGVCGGCALQHMDPDAQIAFKEKQLFENLQRIGKVAPRERLPALRGPVWNYRRRARLGVKWVDAKQRVLVGFREKHKYYITDMQDCDVLVASAARLIRPLAELIPHLSLRERLPQIEVAAGDDAVGLVLRVLQTPTAEDLALLQAFENEHGIRLFLQSGGPHTVVPLSAGTQALHYRLPEFDVEFEFLPTDFVQINGELNARMVARVVELLGAAPGMRVLDLFCGLGNFTLPIARTGAQVLGVELEKELVARARHNAQLNGLEAQAEFLTGNLFEPAELSSWGGRSHDAVLLDPPRAGAEAVCRKLDRRAPAQVVYVSCHPGTLARDAGILVHEQGYRLEAAGVMDMFPHTSHVEALAVFRR